HTGRSKSCSSAGSPWANTTCFFRYAEVDRPEPAFVRNAFASNPPGGLRPIAALRPSGSPTSRPSRHSQVSRLFIRRSPREFCPALNTLVPVEKLDTRQEAHWSLVQLACLRPGSSVVNGGTNHDQTSNVARGDSAVRHRLRGPDRHDRSSGPNRDDRTPGPNRDDRLPWSNGHD